MKAKEFSKALLYHLNWKVRIRRFLEGKGHMAQSDFASPQDCCLKKWICSREITQYASRPEILELETLHTEMHEIAKRIYELKVSGHDRAARQEFKKMDEATEKLLLLLNTRKIINNN
ncbi:MAG TPA: hypothetical protein DCP92_13790 [Nitrospiraceae bacterium]|jgi:hypothetical protein|nr:hypothetical protein [Nitrospiraceae bacterium]